MLETAQLSKRLRCALKLKSSLCDLHVLRSRPAYRSFDKHHLSKTLLVSPQASSSPVGIKLHLKLMKAVVFGVLQPFTSKVCCFVELHRALGFEFIVGLLFEFIVFFSFVSRRRLT